MRRYWHIMNLGTGGNFAHFGQASGPGQVGVEDVGGIEFEDVAKTPA